MEYDRYGAVIHHLGSIETHGYRFHKDRTGQSHAMRSGGSWLSDPYEPSGDMMCCVCHGANMSKLSASDKMENIGWTQICLDYPLWAYI